MTRRRRSSTSTSRVLEPQWTNFLLNCPPNRDGLLDAGDRHAAGTRWARPGARTPRARRCPRSRRRSSVPYTPVGATATSGNADATPSTARTTPTSYTMWQPSGALPQSITLDLGRVQPDVGLLAYVPALHHADGAATTARHVVRDPDQHRRHDVHRGDDRDLAGRRQDEGRRLRPGRRRATCASRRAPPTARPPRPPRSPSARQTVARLRRGPAPWWSRRHPWGVGRDADAAAGGARRRDRWSAGRARAGPTIDAIGTPSAGRAAQLAVPPDRVEHRQHLQRQERAGRPGRPSSARRPAA